MSFQTAEKYPQWPNVGTIVNTGVNIPRRVINAPNEFLNHNYSLWITERATFPLLMSLPSEKLNGV